MISRLFSISSGARSPFYRLSLLSLICLGTAMAALAQQPSPAPDIPKAKITLVKKLPDSGFLLAVKLYASPSKPLILSHSSNAKNPDGSLGENIIPFSLAASTMKDLYSGTVYRALRDVPREPYVGPIDSVMGVAPGGWIQLGVAFPPIPPPPDKDGKKQPYQLLFSVPELKIETSILLDPQTLQPIIKSP
jgi:hypothetical protein